MTAESLPHSKLPEGSPDDWTTSIKFKKIPYSILLLLLTFCYSGILGLLSLGGMLAFLKNLVTLGYVISPALFMPLGRISLALAMLFESEIFKRNFQDALAQLKDGYLTHLLARQYLQENLKQLLQEPDICPEFFKDYMKLLERLERFSHKSLDKKARLEKEALEKTLKRMEKILAAALFEESSEKNSNYFRDLSEWVGFERETWKARLEERSRQYTKTGTFSLLAALFSGLGMPYLIADAVASSALLASIPLTVWIFLIPICALSSGLITFNTINKFINHKTYQKWREEIRVTCKELKAAYEEGGLWKDLFGLRKGFFLVSIASLLALEFTLTFCTAGTWFTIASSSDPIFKGLTKMPPFVMQLVNPIIVFIYNGFFNIQNMAETFERLLKAKIPWETLKNALNSVKDKTWGERLKHLGHFLLSISFPARDNENWIQRFNLVRFFVRLTFTPLKLLLFLGHFVSDAVSNDRVPGLSESNATEAGIIHQAVTESHYFLGDPPHHHKEGAAHNHNEELIKEYFEGHGHSHEDDIPTFILKCVYSPFIALTALWDSGASYKNDKENQLSFSDAFMKHWEEQEEAYQSTAAEPMEQLKQEEAIYLTKKHGKKQFQGLFLPPDSNRKKEFDGFQEQLRTEKWRQCINTVSHNPHGLYSDRKLVAKLAREFPSPSFSQ